MKKDLELNLSIQKVLIGSEEMPNHTDLSIEIIDQLEGLMKSQGIPVNLVRSRKYQALINIRLNDIIVSHKGKDISTSIAVEIYRQLQSAR